MALQSEVLKMTMLIFAEEVFAIVGAAFEVYNKMGTGFLEPVFKKCWAWN